MSFNSGPTQPNAVFFNLKFGNLDNIYVSPEIPMNLEVTIGSDSAIEFSATLYDLTGYDVEPQLWAARNPDYGNMPGGTMRWGWLTGPQSKEWSWQLDDYTPSFAGNAFSITLNGSGLRTPSNSSNANSGTLEEILNKFAKDHNLTLNIDPPFGTQYLADVGRVEQGTTDSTEMLHHKWINESDLAYIERLLQFARDGEGKGGYRFYIDTSDGKKDLHIIKPKGAMATYQFVVQDKESTVISWEPDISFLGNVLGGDDVQQNAYQSLTGDELKMVMNQSNTQVFQDLLGYSLDGSTYVQSVPPHGDPDQIHYTGATSMPDIVTGSTIRARSGASSSNMAGLNPVLNTHLIAWQNCLSGTLTIQGDPDIEPTTDGELNYAEVICYYPLNYKNTDSKNLHYSSGIYLIDEVVHKVEAGQYTTTLKLLRAAGNEPEAQEENNS